MAARSGVSKQLKDLLLLEWSWIEMKTIGIGIIIQKTVTVRMRFSYIYETNKIKYGKKW